MIRTIYLDMDGVLANFDKRYQEITGQTEEEVKRLNSASFWELLGDAKENIYAELEPMHDAQLLVHHVCTYALQNRFGVAVLSAIPKLARIPKAKSHKYEWIKEYFPILTSNFNIGPWAQDKYKHCIPGDILIDDKQINIDQWNEAGGIGILHTTAENSVDALYRINK